MDGLQFASLRSVAQTALLHHPAWQFRYISAPLDLKDEATPNPFKSMFDPKLMRQLYAAGEDVGRQGFEGWKRGLPPDDAEIELAPAPEAQPGPE